MKKHDFFLLMGAVKESLASDYSRIRARSREDPGTAGDQAEENWAEIFRQWLPPTYQIVTKGRILFEDGSSSPQVDVLVLTPSYPRGLGNEKYLFSGGVVAAFECKLTLRSSDVKDAFRTAAAIKRKAPKLLGNPYDELNCPPIFGLLAHSHSLGKSRKRSWKLHETVERYQASSADHPRELLDLVCVADSATIVLGKHALIGPDLTSFEIQELNEIEHSDSSGVVSMMYTYQDEELSGLDSTGAILAALIYELTNRLAIIDESVRPWADHLSKLGFYGGIGRPFYCSEEVLSAPLLGRLRKQRLVSDPWSKWIRNRL